MNILAAKIVKHSVRIKGHMTSISLEDPFWTVLQDIAAKQNQSVNDLIAEIDSGRGTNLSSALRLYVLDYLLKKSY